MKLKNELIVISLILFILISISAVSAVNNNTEIITTNNNVNDNVISINDLNNESILTEGNDGSFADLNTKINGDSSTNIVLDKNYIYSSRDTIKDGIVIDKNNIIIDGQGHTIDAKGKTRIFNITATTVTLKNINFVNGFTEGSGGAIRGYGDNLRVLNCTFADNTAGSWGGAIFSYPDSYTAIVNSTFENNKAKVGGAVSTYNYVGHSSNIDYTNYGARHDIVNCTFNLNTATDEGGALSIMGQLGNTERPNDDRVNIRGCLFTGNDAPEGKAISNMLSAYINMTDSVILGNPEDVIYSWGAMFFADYNWWGNTVNNPSLKPNLTSGVKFAKWLYMDFVTDLETTSATVSINNLYDGKTGETSVYSTSRLPAANVKFTAVNATLDVDNAYLDNSGKYELNFVLLGDATLTAKIDNVAITKKIKIGGLLELEQLIRNTDDNSVIKLDKDYFYTPGIDLPNHRISISNKHNLVIDGNGHTLNAMGKTLLFSVDHDSTGITFKNLNLVNGKSNDGVDGAGAYVAGADTNFINCTFRNNTAIGYGSGAALHMNAKGSVVDCKFINNTHMYSSGGAISWSNGVAVIRNTLFENNTASETGGALLIKNGADIVNSTFRYNRADGAGAIFTYTGDHSDITNCTFIGNDALSDEFERAGGALYIGNATITNSAFINNTAKVGAAVCIVSPATTIDGSIFINNTATSPNGIVYGMVKGGKVVNSIFLNNNINYGYIICSLWGEIQADYNWYGNTYKDYARTPHVSNLAVMSKWIFLNATSPVFNEETHQFETELIFSIYDSNTKTVIEFDAEDLPAILFKLSGENLTFDKDVVAIEEKIVGNLTYRITIGEEGYIYIYDYKGTIIAEYENFKFVLPVSNIQKTWFESNSTIQVAKGEYEYFSFILHPFENDYLPFLRNAGRLTYIVNDTSVIRYNKTTDRIYGLKIGLATITVKFDGKDVMGRDKYTRSNMTVLVNVTKPQTEIRNATDIPEFAESDINDRYIIFNLYTKKGKLISGASLEFINNNPDVLSFDARGNTIWYKVIGDGLANITINAPEGADYQASTRTITFEVGKRTPEFDIEDNITMKPNSFTWIDNPLKRGNVNKLSFISNDTSVATMVDESTHVTINTFNYGVANITIKFDGDEEYRPATKYLIVYVLPTQTYIDIDSEISLLNNTTKGLNPILRDMEDKHIGGNFEFSSNDTKVANITSYGMISAVGLGKANITIISPAHGEYAAAKANVVVTVYKASNEITVTSEHDMNVGERIYLNATTQLDSSYSKMPLNYSSNDTSVVSVDKWGYIYAKKAGKAKITVKYEGSASYYPDTKYVFVTVTTQSNKINVTPEIEMHVDERITLDATLEHGGQLRYWSNDTSVAVIDINGRISSYKAGVANITVSYKGSDKYDPDVKYVIVTVTTQSNDITVNSEADVHVDDRVNLNATLKYGGKLSYSSNDTSVVTVDQMGYITARKVGMANITVRYEGSTKYDPDVKYVIVSVSRVPTSIDVEKSYAWEIGETDSIQATLNPQDAGSLTFKSNNESVVKVDKIGRITAIAVGTTDIVVSYAGTEKYLPANSTIAVTVYLDNMPSSIEVNKTFDLYVGDEIDIDAVLIPSNAGELIYTSSDDSIVKIDSTGIMTALKAGEADITINFTGNKRFLASSAQVHVVVSLIPTSIEANKSMAVNLTEKIDLDYVFSHPEAGDLKFDYDKSIISIENGKIKGEKIGKTSLTILFEGNGKYSSSNATIEVTVSDVETSMDVDDELNVNVTESKAIDVILNPKDVNGVLEFISNDTNIVSVDAKGNVKGIKVGTATVTVNFIGSGKYRSVSKNVTVKVVDVETSIDAVDEINVNVTESKIISVVLNPKDAKKYGALEFISNDTTVVSVNANGNFKGIKVGTATVTVNFIGSGKYRSASKNVTVNVVDVETSIEAVDEISINVTESTKINAALTPNVGSLKFSSSDSSIVTVDNRGNIRGIKVGAAVVTISFEDKNGKYRSSNKNVTVNVVDVETSIETADEIDVNVTESAVIAAVLNPSKAQSAGLLKFASNDTSIVTVDNKGNIKGIKVGTAVVTISFEDKNRKYRSASKNVTVNVVDVETKITVDEDIINMIYDEQTNINASVTPYGNKLSYVSDNATIVSVDGNGNIKALKPGMANILISYAGEGKYRSSNKTVTVNVNRAPSYIIVDDTMNLEIGEGTTIKATTEPKHFDLTYKSSDNSIVEFDKNGYLFTVSYGSALVTISFAGDEYYLPSNATVTVNVSPRLTEIKVNNSVSIGFGEKLNLGAYIYLPVSHMTLVGKLNYVSSDSEIVTVNNDGEITANKIGNAKIYISYDGDRVHTPSNATVDVEVTTRTTHIVLDHSSVSLHVNDVSKVNATLVDGPSNYQLRYISNNDSVVRVNPITGAITALSEGNAVITVTYPGDNEYHSSSANFTVSVLRYTTHVHAANSVDIVVYESQDLYAVVTPNEGPLTYTSSDESVVTVNNGIVTGKKSGSAIITINFAGDNQYRPSHKQVIVSVGKVPTSINLTDMTLNAGDEIDLGKIVLPEGVPTRAKYYEYISMDTEVFDVDNGVITTFQDGKAELYVSFKGDDIYLPSNKSVMVNVVKKVLQFGEYNFTVDVDDDARQATFTLLLPEDAEGYFTVSLNGEMYGEMIENGKAVVVIDEFEPDDYTATLRYGGDLKYASISNTTKFHVGQYKIDKNKDIDVYLGSTGTYTVHLTKDTQAMENKTITFKVNGKTYQAVTDMLGYASIKVKLPASKVYTITAQYGNVKVSNKFKVHVIVAKNLKTKKTKNLKVSISLKKVNKKYLSNKKVTLKFRGKTYTAFTNKKAVVTFTINKSVFSKLKVGKSYNYVVKYAKDSVTKTIKITK